MRRGSTGAGLTLLLALAAFATPALPSAAHAGEAVPVSIASLPNLVYGAHRGGALEGRENGLSGFQRALDSGVVDVLDTDVRRLASGELVVMHDPTVRRTTTSTGKVSSYTLTRWRGLSMDIGSWLKPAPPAEAPPTLEQLLDRFGGKAVLTLEVKDGAVDDVAHILQNKGLVDSVFVNTNDPEVARHIHDAGLWTHLWRSAAQMQDDDPRDFKPYVDLLDIDIRAPRDDISKFVGSGVPRVWAHTVTTRAERRRAVRLGVDGIITDDPRYVSGVSDTFPVSPTRLLTLQPPDRTQVSDPTTMTAVVSTSSGSGLPGAVATARGDGVTSATVGTRGATVRILQLATTHAQKGQHALTLSVAAGAGRERRWPAAARKVGLRLTGEDLELRPRLLVDSRRLTVRVGLLDSAAEGYAGPRPELGAARTVAGLARARLRLEVRHAGVTVHRAWISGADTGVAGNGSGSVTFGSWTAPEPGRYRVRVVQRGEVYRGVAAVRRVRLR